MNKHTLILNDFVVESHVKNALNEDIGFGDITTDSIVSKDKTTKAFLNTREDGILCGVQLFRKVFEILDKNIKIEFYFNDGDTIKKGDTIAKIEGNANALLKAERTALNYIQKLSGISTHTNKYVEKIKDYKAKVVDTRKNTPGFRLFEKYAILQGGGSIHRFNLSDCVMIKDNHINYAGSITKAVELVKSQISHAHKIEVECDTIKQVIEALNAKVDIIMLDNMKISDIEKSVKLINDNAIIEVSGKVTLENIEEIAKTNVDIISTSSLINKAQTLDLGLDF